jgi:hypothetical protein
MSSDQIVFVIMRFRSIFYFNSLFNSENDKTYVKLLAERFRSKLRSSSGLSDIKCDNILDVNNFQFKNSLY